MLPKSVTPSRIEENFHGACVRCLCSNLQLKRCVYAVRRLPDTLFEKLEKAAVSHPPRRVVNPSKRLNLPYDIFDDDGGVIVPDSL